MIQFPNAKINIGLQVLKKRADGFHELSTVFYPVNYTDCLEIRPSDAFAFESYHKPIPGKAEENLCVKAYTYLKAKHNLPPVHIKLVKNIPMGAGLGGGSADGAFCLKMLNELFELGYKAEELERIALTLGSDCAFFIRNQPALAGGLGEKLSPIDLDSQLSNLEILVVYPKISIPTLEAYQHIRPNPEQANLAELIQLPVTSWKGQIHNNFEDYAFQKYPELTKIKTDMYDLGAVYASMSGSGSAIYGFFPKISQKTLGHFQSFEFYSSSQYPHA